NFILALSDTNGTSEFHYNLAVDGNLGIGTTNPMSMLHAYAGEVQIGSSGAACTAARNGALRYASGSVFYCTGSTWTNIGTVTSSSAGQMAYFKTTGTTVIGTSTVNVVNARVGIGTANPTSLLHAYTSTTSAVVATFQNGTGTCTFAPTAGA